MRNTGNSRVVVCIHAMVDFKEDIIMILMVMIIMMMVKAIFAIITHRDDWHLLGTLVPLQGSWLRTRLVLS